MPQRLANVFGKVLPCVIVLLKVKSNLRYGITDWGVRHTLSGPGLEVQHVTKYLLIGEILGWEVAMAWTGGARK